MKIMSLNLDQNDIEESNSVILSPLTERRRQSQEYRDEKKDPHPVGWQLDFEKFENKNRNKQKKKMKVRVPNN